MTAASTRPRTTPGLILFLIFQTFFAFIAGVKLPTFGKLMFNAESPFWTGSPNIRLMIEFEAAAVVITILATVIGFGLIIRRMPSAVGFWLGALILTVAAYAADGYLVRQVLPELPKQIAENIQAKLPMAFAGMLMYLLWFFYWLLSSSLHEVFAPVSAAAPAPVAASSGAMDETARFRGRETKPCPTCGKTLLRAAVYCGGCKQAIESA